MVDPAAKFDAARADAYAAQSRIALAGYEACHELAACMLAAQLGPGSRADILVVGAGGTGTEVVTMGRLEASWRFVGVDPSAAMLDLAAAGIEAAGLTSRARLVLGQLQVLPADAGFDAATLIGVLHHLPGDSAKKAILADVAARLKPGAPFILACNHHAYASQPLLLSAWTQRWRMNGAAADEIEARLEKILEGADPPGSEEAVLDLLRGAGFAAPVRFFTSLFWSAWSVEKAR